MVGRFPELHGGEGRSVATSALTSISARDPPLSIYLVSVYGEVCVRSLGKKKYSVSFKKCQSHNHTITHQC